MKITELVWLDKIRDKIIQKHRVQPDEVHEAFFDPRRKYFFVESGHIEGEDVYAIIGKADAGRLLAVYFILKPGHKALIVSARDATKKQRRRYERK